MNHELWWWNLSDNRNICPSHLVQMIWTTSTCKLYIVTPSMITLHNIISISYKWCQQLHKSLYIEPIFISRKLQWCSRHNGCRTQSSFSRSAWGVLLRQSGRSWPPGSHFFQHRLAQSDICNFTIWKIVWITYGCHLVWCYNIWVEMHLQNHPFLSVLAQRDEFQCLYKAHMRHWTGAVWSQCETENRYLNNRCWPQ